MRLLQRSDTGEYSLTRAFASNEAIPPYAILSHTWLEDAQEPTFEDLINGTGGEKLGYEKIRFCQEQANRDGLKYFWVDTCCINKSNYAELSHAINSMFCWYRNATRCYVYLSDVTSPCINDDSHSQWDSDLGRSRWFTRGWTLQELLAPRSIEFFSCERTRIGDRSSLRQQIQQITGIPALALQGVSLSQSSVDERFLWIERRQTKLAEDKVYSLLGILDVKIPLYYGEGAGNAFKRVREVINKRERCTQDLRITDPRDDKKRIEDTKGGLLVDSYCWILKNSDFQRWHDNQQSQLLWIKGDPGKGKTMLLCGIINELNKELNKPTAKTALLSYFFCQATDTRINNAIAVLRGLLYVIINQQPSLISHIRKKYDHAGKALFEDANAWVALCEIFANILQDPNLGCTYLVVDALDECVVDLLKLLDFITQQSSASPCVKWVLSSRNWPDIEERLAKVGQRLSLELNAESVSAAVDVFIQEKVHQLAQDKKYDDKTREALQNYLSTNAEGTFLWVALVCQNLRNVPKRNVIKKLNTFPPGLDSLYERMMQQISNSDDADICKEILAIAATAYQPTRLEELVALAEQLEEVAGDPESIQDIIGHCGSFLTLRNNTVYFVHQSAKDFLLANGYNNLFPSGKKEVHRALFLRSLQAMSGTLQRDMYDLHNPGYPIDQVKQSSPDPLAASRYSCIYWIDHLCDSSYDSSAGHSIDNFIRNKYLYWLEALSLCRSISKGIVSMKKLEGLVQRKSHTSPLVKLIEDASRFIMSYKSAIENYPLQAYISALVFSPNRSLIRSLFKKEEPKWITIKAAIADQWSPCLLTLEGHSHSVRSVAFNHDSTWLASASDDRTVKIWDASSGECLSTLKGHSYSVRSVAFNHDSTQLASASIDGVVKVWDTSSGECLPTLKGHSYSVWSMTFNHDSTWLASASNDRTVKVCDASSGEYLSTLEDHRNFIRSVAFNHDSTWLASASNDRTVKIRDTSSGECLLTLEGHSCSVLSMTFNHDSTQLASASIDGVVKVWDTISGECLSTLEGHSNFVRSVAFNHDATWLASALDDRTVKVRDTSRCECLSTLKGHSHSVRSVAFNHDSTRLASASDDRTVKVWDTISGECLSTLEEDHSDAVQLVTFNCNSTQLASASGDRTVKIWDASSGECLSTLEGHSNFVWSVAFSHDSTQLASASVDRTVKIWDTSSGECLSTLKGHSHSVRSVTFNHDSTRLASASVDRTVKVWDASSGECLLTLEEDHSDYINSVAFNHDSTQLASASDDRTVKIWDASSGECLSTLKGHSYSVRSVAFNHNSTQLVSASIDRVVKVWDASSSECLLTLEVERILSSISFDISNPYLLTDVGIIDVSALCNSSPVPTNPKAAQYQGLGLGADGMWIKYNSENLVWLPSEYRPYSSAVSGNIIGIGVGNGKVWACKVQRNNF